MAHARVILELLYFLSGIVLTGVAIVGMRQVRIAAAQVKLASEQLNLSRELASANAKREAAKLAAEQCRYFAEKCVPAFEHFIGKYRANHLTFLEARLKPTEPQFVIQGGEFQSINCNVPLIQREFLVVQSELLAVLNGLEYFAIAFAAGVADEDIGYRETALGFCEAVVFTMAAIYHLRTQNRGRYDSAVRLFEIWTRRTIARSVAPFMSSMQALIAQANSDKIKIIGLPENPPKS
jgi:hypothetical protein